MRPEKYIDETRKILEENGFEIISAPFLKIEEVEVDISESYDYVIVTSQTSARIVVERYPELLKGRIIAIGRKTASVFEGMGVENVETPSKFDSKTLYEEFHQKLRGKRVAIVRSNMGDPVLLKLKEFCDVDEIVVYRIEFEHGDKQREFLRRVAEGEAEAIVFSSRMMVRSFFSLAEKLDLVDDVKNALKKMRVVAIGPPTKSELERYGVDAVMPEEYTFEGVVSILKS
ncbi:Uroporphyrinogen-III synthase [Archaeoglobus sulfaticallidus PM70-1]|uniref:Uroporphyrinogen-III synthase n=2 Tax=Archaeoglobus TaxID=2233 RepID=N0BAC6_9EURY|nr:Uroporphyrinogen-III synthase [Archaeoglobus sulfaticallidus PM70-1]